MAKQAKSTVEMPAGYEKDEQLKINADALAEQAEDLEALADVHAADPKVFKQVDNEIAVHFNNFNELEVSNPDPLYVYCWVGTAARGVMVTAKLAIRVRDAESGHMVPCWEVVQGSMKESEENRDATGVRRVGDAILMRCRKDRYFMLLRAQKEQVRRQQEAATAEILDAEMQMHRRGIPIRVETNSALANPALRHLARKAAAKGIAKAQFEAMIREGRIPGMPAPGVTA